MRTDLSSSWWRPQNSVVGSWQDPSYLAQRCRRWLGSSHCQGLMAALQKDGSSMRRDGCTAGSQGTPQVLLQLAEIQVAKKCLYYHRLDTGCGKQSHEMRSFTCRLYQIQLPKFLLLILWMGSSEKLRHNSSKTVQQNNSRWSREVEKKKNKPTGGKGALLGGFFLLI